jgi:glutamate racemase
MRHASPIGVFDSGIGGLSILKALRLQMPHERFVYFADSKHNPYGEKSEAFVQERSLCAARELVEQHGIKALVVACNTATAAAIALLREAYPALPIIGVEPALKPAAQVSRTRRVGVLATRGTLQSAKFAALKASLAHVDFVCTPCDGLAEQIEHLAETSGSQRMTPNLIANCEAFIRATGRFGLKKDELDTLVLGCTHYPLIRDVFTQLVGSEVTIVDNAMPVAQRTAQLLLAADALSERAGDLAGIQAPGVGTVVWQSSGNVEGLLQSARYWLGGMNSGVVSA